MPTAAVLEQTQRWFRRNNTAVLIAASSAFSGTVLKKTTSIQVATSGAWTAALLRAIAEIKTATMSTFAGALLKATSKIQTASMSAFAGTRAVLVKVLNQTAATLGNFSALLVTGAISVLRAHYLPIFRRRRR